MKLSLRLRRRLIISAGVVAAYAIIGFFVVPPILRSQLEKRAAVFLLRPVKVAQVRVNPFVMSVTVDGFVVTDHDGGELASWEQIYANFDPLTSLFRRQWHLGELRVKHPRKRLVIAADGTLNIADLFPPASSAPADAAPGQPFVLPAVGIGLLQVENWEVDFTDKSHRRPYHTVAGPLSYELRDFSTKPGRDAPYTFTGATDSTERLAWSGTISAAPFGSRGRIEILNTSLSHQMPFLDEQFAGEINAGRVSQIINYEVAIGDTITARISDSTITVDNLDVRLVNATDTAVALQKLEIHVAQADLIARTAEISRVAITGLDAHVARLADGSIDLLSLLPPTPATPVNSAADSGPAPSVHVAEIALLDGRVQLTDHTTPRAGTITLDQINVTAANVGTDLDREIRLDAKARWDGGGTLTASGVVRARPLAATLDLEGSGITLRPLETWVETVANVHIASGTEHFRGHVDASQTPEGKLSVTWVGESGIDNLDVRDRATGGELLGWKSLTYANTRFNLEPLEFSVGEIALVAPTAHVTIDENGALNVAAIRPVAAADAAPASAPSAAPAEAKTSEVIAAATRPALPFAARIDAITITDGRFSFSDRSVPGGFSTELRDFSGSIKGLSSANLARADVDLAGSLDGAAPLRIKGAINPLANDRFSDVTVSFSNIDLPPFTPFSGKYLGRKIQKGKLVVNVTYKISQTTLEAENHIVLDQFYLGEPVASPVALKLPVGLALALLRDREGRIDLDVPIRGDLDDPDFKYGRAVWHVVGNVITKSATAPFSLLGGLFGGKEQDLSYVDFMSGSATLGESGLGKLEVIAKSLYERPALRLEISSPAAPDGDRAGLRDRRFVARLLAERQTVAAASGSAASLAEADAPLTAEETEVLVRIWFARRFPEEAAAAQSATGSLAAPVVTEGEARKPGFFGRVVGSIFHRGEKSDAPPAPAPAPDAAAPATTAEAPPPLTLADMQARLLDTITLTDADFQELAAARAREIRDHLLADGKVEPERVFLVSEPKVPEGANNAIEGGRVFFGLE